MLKPPASPVRCWLLDAPNLAAHAYRSSSRSCPSPVWYRDAEVTEILE